MFMPHIRFLEKRFWKRKEAAEKGNSRKTISRISRKDAKRRKKAEKRHWKRKAE